MVQNGSKHYLWFMKNSSNNQERRMVYLDAIYSVTAYEKEFGKSRSTIYRHAKVGKIDLVDVNGSQFVIAHEELLTKTTK